MEADRVAVKAFRAYMDILEKVLEGTTSPTKIAEELDMYYNQFKKYLEDMKTLGLITVEHDPRPGSKLRVVLTELGNCMARCYKERKS